jgi:hypothetical protein
MTKEPVKKTVKLYGGQINIEFNNLARNRYVVMEDGHSPVGVTSLLQILNKPALMTWPMFEAIAYLKINVGDYEGAAKAYLTKSDKGKDVGTEVHKAIELYLGGKPYPLGNQLYGLSKEAFGAYEAFKNWFNLVKPKVLATEQIIYSKQCDYAGTYDALLEIDGQVVLCDVKTTNASRTAPLGIYPEYFLQLGAYALAHHEENPEQQIDDVMIIRVGKDGVLNTLRASELGFKLSYLEDTFKQLVQVYRMVTPLSKQLSELKEKK